MASMEFAINTRKMKYTGVAMAALKQSHLEVNLRTYKQHKEKANPNRNDEQQASQACMQRIWLRSGMSNCSPQSTGGRHIGTYALTTKIAPWLEEALSSYQPTNAVLELVQPFSCELHALLEKERAMSSGLHDLDIIEMTYQEDYVYAALTGVDWAKGKNKFNDRLVAFEALARSSVPTLDAKSDIDLCFWRISLAYLARMNDCENARPFKTPKTAYIDHALSYDLVISARGLDTIGSAYMSRDGAAWLDDEGLDSIIGSAVPNDVMDLHTDILTGETRNLLRLLYPQCSSIEQATNITSVVLSSMLCEIFRGHYRARMLNREDGRVSSTSPATWNIYHTAKSQFTDEAISELLICGLKRAATGTQLPPSPSNQFFYLWYDMIEDGSAQMAESQPLGVSEDLAPIIRSLHSLWHAKLLDSTKKPGWGREFDRMSDTLMGEAGEILGRQGGVLEDAYKFAIAYGRLSMGLPYIAYHTIDAIIMTFGVTDLSTVLD
ncbi:hypothetical protein NPX13_g4864 [Xylaria arbuscula]|uniref:Uncharacterized protein n=1 Tax=Xylaria arbuscula TaxID=114810 RepID=A0A9W8NFH1_9PEZI|nr:hypothetical protein NPX13_g4864 [Xylaria arbuscula]